jgi:hypothetical protein
MSDNARPQIRTAKGKWAVEILDGRGNWYVPSFADNLSSLAAAEKKLISCLRACSLPATNGRIVEGDGQ